MNRAVRLGVLAATLLLPHLLVAQLQVYTGPVSIDMWSDPGDFIGQGLTFHFDETTPGTYYGPSYSWLYFSLFRVNPIEQWLFTFTSVQGQPLQEGLYTNVGTYPPDSTHASMDISGQARSCQAGGWFDVRHLQRDSSGAITSAWIVFEQHCNGAQPALHGSLRINYAAAAVGVTTLPITALATLALLIALAGTVVLRHYPA